jgi:hypothetical protein
MKRRGNPKTSTLLLWGGALIAAGVAVHAASGTIAPPVVVVTTSGPPIKIPNDIADRMLFAWRAAGSPSNQAGWVQSVSDLIPGMTATQWASVYGSVIGYQQVNGKWPDGNAVISWIRAALGS